MKYGGIKVTTGSVSEEPNVSTVSKRKKKKKSKIMAEEIIRGREGEEGER